MVFIGIGFVQNLTQTANIASPASPVSTEGLTASPTASPKNTGEASGEAVTLAQRAGEAGEAVFPTFAEICNSLSQLTEYERQKLVGLLTQPQPLTKKVTPEDAQAMRDIALVWWPEYYPEQLNG
jgi:putative DNA primase/helicase